MDTNKISGIYKITNTINGKVYIGESENIPRRWIEHIVSLTYGEHGNYKLQNDFKEYGLKAFDFDIMESIPILNESSNIKLKMILLCREDVYIKYFNSFETGYNLEYTLNRIANKEKGLFESSYNNAEKIEKDYNLLKNFINENPNILKIEYKVNQDLTLTLKQIKKNKKKIENAIQNKKLNNDFVINPKKKHKNKEYKEKEAIEGQRFATIFKDVELENKIDELINPTLIKDILCKLNYLYFDENSHSYIPTEKSLNEKLINLNGNTYKTKYGESPVLLFTDLFKNTITDIIKNPFNYISHNEVKVIYYEKSEKSMYQLIKTNK